MNCFVCYCTLLIEISPDHALLTAKGVDWRFNSLQLDFGKGTFKKKLWLSQLRGGLDHPQLPGPAIYVLLLKNKGGNFPNEKKTFEYIIYMLITRFACCRC